ncbi:hypothetical protein J132_01049 [Termitomyces sp. J132]|nr:hypothetical protein J132_01049 [Termitomyces sp. J132]
MLMGCQTQLKFDDFLLDFMDVLNGTTQGCPLSMIFYVFYNAPLILVALLNSKLELSFGFVDDSMLLGNG